MGGGAEKLGREAAPPPCAKIFVTKLFKRPGIALMGSLQIISTRSALGKVVHAVGLWLLTSLTHRARVCSYVCADLLVITKAAFQKRGSMEPMEPPLDPPLGNPTGIAQRVGNLLVTPPKQVVNTCNW